MSALGMMGKTVVTTLTDSNTAAWSYTKDDYTITIEDSSHLNDLKGVPILVYMVTNLITKVTEVECHTFVEAIGAHNSLAAVWKTREGQAPPLTLVTIDDAKH